MGRDICSRQCGAHHYANSVSSLRASPTSIRLTEVVEALDGLKRPEHSGQEQLCDPLVPASTYWYLQGVPELLELVSARLEQLPEALS
jgi:hypothetical protein